MPHTYKVAVVGSGATGGWAAKTLSEAGLDVALLEAGPSISAEEFESQLSPESSNINVDVSAEVVRTHPIQRTCYAFREGNSGWFVDDLANPYSTVDGRPFAWHRLRILGGRTLVWAGQCYRLSDYDFQAAGYDGYGDNWPLSYADVAAYYDKVEKYLGVSGHAERNPAVPDGSFVLPMKMTPGELLLRDRVRDRFNRTVTIGRIATDARNGRRLPCFASPFTTVADALRSGHCDLFTNAVVAFINIDRNTNQARGVTYVDRLTRRTYEVKARAVILCAQALESTRILFNSKTREHPHGLGNSSGVLGHYLMDHATGAGAWGTLYQKRQVTTTRRGRNSTQYASRGQNGIYVMKFRNIPGAQPHRRFIRGYGFQGIAMPMPTNGTSLMRLQSFGESLARYDNYCEVDPELRDAWGIPALRVHMTHGPNEIEMMHDAAETAAEMLDASGAEQIVLNFKPKMPGMAAHEVGTARMGDDPKTSVLNRFNQLHDVKNVLVTDGACFSTSACQNPTLTMMALTVRACDHLINRFRLCEL